MFSYLKHFLFRCFILSFFLAENSAIAALSLPSQLSFADQKEILTTLGPGTSSRQLSSPYPLGGHEGFEIGLSRQFISTSNFTEFGDRSASGEDFSYPILTIGKGLFYDIDLFINLVPFAQSKTITHFSTQGRWNFFRSKDTPFSLSISGNAGNTTLNNLISIQSYGFDLVGSLYIRELSLFFGTGFLSSSGVFVGGPYGINKSGETEKINVPSSHRILGLDYRFHEYFISAEMDHFESPLYSAKVGMRF
jgi:hypothetical protein